MSKIKETSRRKSGRAQAAEQTRRALVEAAFVEMHEHGFQGASIDRILGRTGLTRGALFHHFDSKRALGYAVVDELIRDAIERDWVESLASANAPLEALAALVEHKARTIPREQLLLGCPLNNLSQEMSPLDAGFRDLTRSVFGGWISAIEAALKQARAEGLLLQDVDARESAVAILALYEGGISLTKNAGAREPLLAAARAVRRYLDSLRAVSRPPSTLRHK